ncbi:MAG: hypothetical protein V4548_10160 [Bacteroidota bacterium]
MRKKITWIRSLITGINVGLLTLFGCTDTTEAPNSHDNYVYINNTSKDIVFTINGFDGISQSISLPVQDSLTVSYTGNPGTMPFMTSSSGSHIGGNSVNIKFSGNKCLSYTRVSDTGVFNFMNYDNPSERSHKDFTLYYTITEDMYSPATTCP